MTILKDIIMWEHTDKYMLALCILIVLFSILAECLWHSIEKDREERRKNVRGRV